MFVVDFLVLIYSIILHEIAHGYVADKLGDPTARVHGRLTLNPIPHIDPIMTIALPLILFILNAGVIFGAAKPVPVDPFNLKDPKRDMAIVSLAGPATNLLIAGLFSLLLFLNLGPIVTNILTSGIYLNVTLAIFNLLPIPPLDGSKILAGVLPDNISRIYLSLERFSFLLVFGAIYLFRPLIFGIIDPIIFNITSFLIH